MYALVDESLAKTGAPNSFHSMSGKLKSPIKMTLEISLLLRRRLAVSNERTIPISKLLGSLVLLCGGGL
ncbi:hypothetical protein BpHYR1_038403 [Brachionus plicatilis]|uniref:Uncharacterized protein n=1 Tax=Brachionus plicatilis TaxID=10195 RepID=A0A3M7PCL4_BRAPC|nr:hypothetical protein BpHYR1_038403 [Brachionus plicatilis]